jgi:hypothetical protein
VSVKEQAAKPAKKQPKAAVERTNKRVHVALPIKITYWDKDKKPGLEMACTYDISARGARITNLRCIKQTGEIVAIERGRSKTFCRVVWIGAPNSELKGQVGLQCIENEHPIFEAELKEFAEVYEPLPKPKDKAAPDEKGNRRQGERLPVKGTAELLKPGKKEAAKAALKDLSEMGCLITTKEVLLPGTDIKLVLKIENYDLNLKGKVKHTKENVGVGIEFSEIRKGDRDMLKHLLQKLEEQELEATFQIQPGK